MMKETEIFERAPIPKAVAVLAVPTVVSSLIMVLYNLADTFFVSVLNDPVQNAAVSLTSPLLLAFYSITNLFGVGSASEMSRALGKKDYGITRHCAAFGFYGALVLSSLYSIFTLCFTGDVVNFLGADNENFAATSGYLFWAIGCGTVPSIINIVFAYLIRAEGKSLQASIGTMGGCILNIILDPFFVFSWGLGMGAAGAGLATFLSNCAACLYFLILHFITRKNTYVSLNPLDVRLPGRIIRSIFIVGIPAMIQNLLNVTGLTILNLFASDYGSAAVAAMGISQKIYTIALQMTFGLSDGIMPLIGYNYASKNIARMKGTVIFSNKIAIAFQSTLMCIFFVFAPELIRLFMTNTDVVLYGTHFLRGLSIALPFTCLDYLCVSVFQACGMGLYALGFAALRKIVLEIPALFILNSTFGIYGLSYASAFSEFVVAIVGVICVVRFFKRLNKKSYNALS